MKTYHSSSSAETREIGKKLAQQVARKYNAKGALVLAMNGDLGAGKTTFVQGFFYGFGLKKRAPSPTFIIMRRHAVKHARYKNIFHVDAYRLKDDKALSALDFKATLSERGNIVLIEWAERVKKIVPKDAIWLTFSHGKYENVRSIIIKR